MNSQKKIVSLTALKRQIRRHKKSGKKIAFTNGCFDLVHFGHVRYLETAKKKNRILIVGINTDRSVREIKGPQRPIHPQAQRAATVAAFACVDYVVLFDDDTPRALIQALRPDIVIKGADWRGKEVVGAEVVRAYGGRVELIAYVPGCSTTNSIKKILSTCTH